MCYIRASSEKNGDALFNKPRIYLWESNEPNHHHHHHQSEKGILIESRMADGQ